MSAAVMALPAWLGLPLGASDWGAEKLLACERAAYFGT